MYIEIFLYLYAKLKDFCVTLRLKTKKMSKRVIYFLVMALFTLLLAACKSAEHCNCG